MNSRSWLRLLVIAALFTLLIPLAVATPAASADGDDDQFTPPEKTELKYPNLGSMLNQLVARVEDGEASAEDAAVDGGIIWVNSAGNQARRTWFLRGPYSDPDGDKYINFSPSDEGITMSLEDEDIVRVRLRWDDSWGGASRDFDLFLRHTASVEVVEKSEIRQAGGDSDVPYESMVYTVPSGSGGNYAIFVVHESGSVPDWIQLTVRGVGSIGHYTENGSITNPAESANPGMLAVGAAHYYDINTIASYSSRGPTPDAWNKPDGRKKPDIVGTACGESATYPEYLRDGQRCWFSGTSQAAPHVAGLAAPVRQRFPDYTPEQVAGYLKDNAEARGTVPNNTWGHGFAMLPAIDPRDRAKEYVEEAIRTYREDPEAAKAYYQSAESVITELDLYLILLDGNTIVVNAGFPGAVGVDITGRIGTDAIGNEYGKELEAADEQGTFVDYLIPDPLDDNYRIYWKRTYAVRHDGLVFAAGSWDKDPATEDSLSDPDHVVATIYKAGARLFREGPERTFQYYNTLASIDGERYVFIAAPDGVIVADATMPELLGTNISNLQASDDPELGQKIAALQEDEELWISHMWRNPESGQEERKNTYATRFRGIIFGSGYYGDAPPPSTDPCGQALTGDGAIPGEWASGCDSETVAQDGSGAHPNARFYSFTLAQQAEVTITLDSNDADTLLYLRQGDARSGTALHENDDHQGSRSKSQIQETLAADTYTIEATTYATGETGSFTLTLSGLGTTAPPPGPTPSDPCGETVTGDGAIPGTWASGCDSETPGRGHARFYSFTLEQQSEVTITLESGDADTYLYLREGDARSGAVYCAECENDDHQGTNSQIQQTLAAGAYTIEATTFNAGETGSFTLTLSGLGTATTPEPTPPTPTPTDPCGDTLTDGDGTYHWEWASGCDSEIRPGSHARYLTFTLAQQSEVTITLESGDADAYLYLREDDARSGAVYCAECENDDHQGTNSQIQQTLAAGAYTIEATTFNAGETGSFTLTLSGLGIAAPAQGCSVGLTLHPGDQCSHQDFSIEVDSSGTVIMRFTGNRVDLNNLLLVREVNSWNIEGLP